MKTSYHVHTRWSDGEADIADYIRSAREIGLTELGFSDHYVLTPDGSPAEWAMPWARLGNYVAEVRAAAAESGDNPVVRLGVEADYAPETVSDLREALASYQFDYVIGSMHYFDGFPIDDAAEHWERLTQSERDDIIRGYWVRLGQMAETGLFSFAGHLDLTKKFGFYPSADLSEEISSALDSIARAGMAVEINTSGWHKPCGMVYPDPSIIAACLKRRLPLLVTADAHTPEHLTRDYDRAYALLREMGCTELSQFAGRRLARHPIAP
jgi:histidinol-phosphatase (PHP family)